MTTPEPRTFNRGGWRLAVLLLVVLAVVILLNRPGPNTNPARDSVAAPSEDTVAGPSVSLEMSLPEGESHQVTIPFEEGMTLLAAMQQARDRHPKWDFATQGSNSNALIVAMAGQTNGEPSGCYWTYYLNGEPGQVGISNCRLSEGDDILWKFAPYE